MFLADKITFPSASLLLFRLTMSSSYLLTRSGN